MASQAMLPLLMISSDTEKSHRQSRDEFSWYKCHARRHSSSGSDLMPDPKENRNLPRAGVVTVPFLDLAVASEMETEGQGNGRHVDSSTEQCRSIVTYLWPATSAKTTAIQWRRSCISTAENLVSGGKNTSSFFYISYYTPHLT